MPRHEKLQKGYFLRPVIFTGIANDHRLAREEIFGPVTCIIRFRDYEDALSQANDSDYGLVQVNQNLVVQVTRSKPCSSISPRRKRSSSIWANEASHNSAAIARPAIATSLLSKEGGGGDEIRTHDTVLPV